MYCKNPSAIATERILSMMRTRMITQDNMIVRLQSQEVAVKYNSSSSSNIDSNTVSCSSSSAANATTPKSDAKKRGFSAIADFLPPFNWILYYYFRLFYFYYYSNFHNWIVS